MRPLALILVLLSAACGFRLHGGNLIRIARLADSPSSALVVRVSFAQPPRFFVARVDSLGAFGEILWQVVPRRDTTPMLPVIVRYGTVPPGYLEAAPAVPLTPGRYVLRASYSDAYGRYDFRVSEDGAIH